MNISNTEKQQDFEGDVTCSVLPPNVTASDNWGKHFGREWACGFKLPHENNIAIFFDERLKSKDQKLILEVINSESPAAHIITCDGNEWVAKTESLDNGRFGVIVYTSKGKAVMSGTGRVTKDGNLKYSVKTLYPRIRNRMRVTAGCGFRDGGLRCYIRCESD